MPEPSNLTPTDLQTDNSQTTLRKNRSPYQTSPITVPLAGLSAGPPWPATPPTC